MGSVKINTDAVIATAEEVKQLNAEMRDGFTEVQQAITRLNNSWDGSASEAAISKFNEMKEKFCDARYNVLDNYANFLLNQVGEGYNQTENVNISLADQFK